MLFITGDTHGDFTRFSFKRFPKGRELTKADIVLICGDFGGVFVKEDGRNIPEENYWLNWLNDRPFTTVFVSGNHENHPRLAQLPVEQWHGGHVHVVRPSVIHLMSGHIFELCEHSIFVFGGASSHDKHLRTEGINWWPEELPTREDVDQALHNLDDAKWHVDIVASHSIPDEKLPFVSGLTNYDHDIVTNALQVIDDQLTYSTWYSGHYHKDIWIDGKTRLIYNDIVEID